jgi:hypothetical protein
MNTTNNDTDQKANRLMKTLAVIGFVVAVIFATWAAVQLVRLLPTAFTSLANLAERVERGPEQQNTIIINDSEDVVGANEPLTISWSEVKRRGVYTLEYDCTEGVALDIRVGANDVTRVPCDELFTLPSDVTSVDAVFTSEANRFTDVTYRIGFIKEGEADPFIDDARVITLVNATIPQGQVLAAEDTPETTEPAEDEPVAEPEPSTPVTTPAASTRYVYTTTYQVPVSDPAGYTDLAVRFLGVGEFRGDRYVNTGVIREGNRGAFQFEVKNIGTKTSGEWEFTALLTGGSVYESRAQAPLKPNERSVLTLAFDNVGQEGANRFGVTVSGGGDTRTGNNEFTWATFVTD